MAAIPSIIGASRFRFNDRAVVSWITGPKAFIRMAPRRKNVMISWLLVVAAAAWRHAGKPKKPSTRQRRNFRSSWASNNTISQKRSTNAVKRKLRDLCLCTRREAGHRIRRVGFRQAERQKKRLDSLHWKIILSSPIYRDTQGHPDAPGSVRYSIRVDKGRAGRHGSLSKTARSIPATFFTSRRSLRQVRVFSTDHGRLHKEAGRPPRRSSGLQGVPEQATTSGLRRRPKGWSQYRLLIIARAEPAATRKTPAPALAGRITLDQRTNN